MNYVNTDRTTVCPGPYQYFSTDQNKDQFNTGP